MKITIEKMGDFWQFTMQEYGGVTSTGTAPTLEGIWDLIQEVLSEWKIDENIK